MERRFTWLTVLLATAMSSAAFAQGGKPAKPAPGSDNYDELYARYLTSARTTATPATTPNFGWMAGLAIDPRARAVNDLVTIRVVESIVATGTADSALSKESSSSLGVSNFFGIENKLPDWVSSGNLVSATSDTNFKGGGATSRSGELSALVTARVIEVLPNGDLVLEGAREIDINGDRQIIVLTGVVRSSDVNRNNVVLSTEIGQFRIRYFGRGLMKDNLQPGWLVRVLNKIF